MYTYGRKPDIKNPVQKKDNAPVVTANNYTPINFSTSWSNTSIDKFSGFSFDTAQRQEKHLGHEGQQKNANAAPIKNVDGARLNVTQLQPGLEANTRVIVDNGVDPVSRGTIVAVADTIYTILLDDEYQEILQTDMVTISQDYVQAIEGDEAGAEADEYEQEEPQEDNPEEKEGSEPPPSSKVRYRERDENSEGESLNEDLEYVYRALRDDELVGTGVIKARQGFDPDKTITQHVTSGSKAEGKSKYISATRSIKVATAWSAHGKKKGGRIGVMHLSKRKRESACDFTEKNPRVPLGSTGLNAARSSQEVVLEGEIPAFALPTLMVSKKVYDAYDVGDEYEDRIIAHKIRTRRKTKEQVKCYFIFEPDPYDENAHSPSDSSDDDSSDDDYSSESFDYRFPPTYSVNGSPNNLS